MCHTQETLTVHRIPQTKPDIFRLSFSLSGLLHRVRLEKKRCAISVHWCDWVG